MEEAAESEVPGQALIWIAIAGPVDPLHDLLQNLDATVAYAGGLASAWAFIESSAVSRLDEALNQLGLAGLLIRNGDGEASRNLLGHLKGRELLNRVSRALDPESCFLPFPA